MWHEKMRSAPSPAQLAWWARFGETHWARGTNDRSPGQPWSAEEEKYLVQMVKTHGPKWTHILKVDRGNDGANKFADGRAPKHLRDKHRHLIDTAARAAAAEATDHA